MCGVLVGTCVWCVGRDMCGVLVGTDTAWMVPIRR